MYLLFIFLLSIAAGYALLYSGLPPTHDGEYHVVRFYEFDKTLRDGDWYPRWASDFNKGYGIPLFNYVYPLPNYIASFFHFLGFSFIDTFKLNMFVATIVGGIFFYLWARNYWKDIGGVVGAVFYIFSPYRFVDMYVRGSVGEVWALAFFPAFLWSIQTLYVKKNALYIVSSGVFLSLIIFSHNILALMFLPLGLSYGLYLFSKESKKNILLFLFPSILLGFGLSSIFWLPALFEQEYVKGLQIYSVEKNFPEVYQLLIPSWGTGFSEGGLENQMSFQIGIANLGAVLLSFFTIVVLYKKKDKRFTILLFFLCWFFLVLFLLLKASIGIWQNIPFMDYFQFPWRFLSLIILITSFLAGAIFSIWQSKILAGFLILFTVLLSLGYAKPAYYHQRDDLYYLTRANFIEGTNSVGDFFNTIWFNTNLSKKSEKFSFANGEGKINITSKKTTKYKATITTTLPSEIIVNTAYFPGWMLTVDGKSNPLYRDKDGVMRFSISPGEHNIVLWLSNTNIQQIGTSIFFSSLLLFTSLLIYYRVIIKK